MTTRLTLDFIIEIYRRFGNDLDLVRNAQRNFYTNSVRPASVEQSILRRTGRYLARNLRLPGKAFMSLRPQCDDVESEISYLLVRALKPHTIVELSPYTGWSTSWMLHGLKDNRVGRLHSFDIIDDSTRILPPDLTQGRWEFTRGDVRRQLDRLPKQIDHLSMDSDHSEEFARWYIEMILPTVRPGGVVSVHDVFHTADPRGHDQEGGVIIDWLAQNKKEFFTASPAKEPTHFGALSKLREEIGLGGDIHHSKTNSMIVFRM